MPEQAVMVVWVAVGGGVGGLGRYWISGWISRWRRGPFPWGTLAVNWIGAGAAGIIAARLSTGAFDAGGADAVAALLLVGVCGAFTTVSSFSLESLGLVRDGQAGRAAAYVLATVAGCLIMVAVGFSLAGGIGEVS